MNVHQTRSRPKIILSDLYRKNLIYCNYQTQYHYYAITEREKVESLEDNRTSVEKELDRLANIERVKSFICYECMLPKYFDLFIQNGYDTLIKIANLTDEILIELNVASKGDRLIILNKAKKIQFNVLGNNKDKDHHRKLEKFIRIKNKLSKSSPSDRISSREKSNCNDRSRSKSHSQTRVTKENAKKSSKSSRSLISNEQQQQPLSVVHQSRAPSSINMYGLYCNAAISDTYRNLKPALAISVILFFVC